MNDSLISDKDMYMIQVTKPTCKIHHARMTLRPTFIIDQITE